MKKSVIFIAGVNHGMNGKALTDYDFDSMTDSEVDDFSRGWTEGILNKMGKYKLHQMNIKTKGELDKND